MHARIGPWGQIVDFKCPSSVDIGHGDRSSFMTTIGGRVVEQRGPTPRRQWQVQVGVGRPDQMAQLEALGAGTFGPPPWVWVSPDAAAQNMMTPASSLLEVGTYSSTGSPMGSHIAPDGVRIPRSVGCTGGDAVDMGHRAVGHGVPAVPGDVLTASIYGQGDGFMTLIFRDLTGAWMGGYSASFTNEWERHHVTATAPDGSAEAILRITSSGGPVVGGAPAITETASPMPWTVGKGCAKATVSGLDTSVLRAVPGVESQNFSRYELVVREIG